MWDEDKGLIVNLGGREGSIVLKLLGTHSSIMGRDIFIPPATMKIRSKRKSNPRPNEPNLMRFLTESQSPVCSQAPLTQALF